MVQLTGRWIGDFTITAEGGTVNYTVSLPSNPSVYGSPTLLSPTGTLTNGQSATVQVHVTDPSAATQSIFYLTVNPGNIQVEVVWPIT